MTDTTGKNTAIDVLARVDDFVAVLRRGNTPPPSPGIKLVPRKADMPLGNIVASQIRDLDQVFCRLIEEAMKLPDPVQKDMLLRLAVRVAQQSARSTRDLTELGMPRPFVVDVTQD